MQKRFGTDIDDLLNFRDWVLKENCDCVAIESTGVYWYPVNAVLVNKVELILANAHQIKHTPMHWTFSRLGITLPSHTNPFGQELIRAEKNGCKERPRWQKD
jgi:hypothetical protein